MAQKRRPSNKKKTTEVSAEDRTLFRETVAKARPLLHKKIATRHPKPKIPRPKPPVSSEELILPALSSTQVEEVGGETTLTYVQGGLNHKMQRRLRQGRLLTMARLDLHGYTVAKAEQKLWQFIAECQQRDLRQVLIIHGKGQRQARSIAMLKSHVNHWLRQHPAVLAFHTARPEDGGTGALYVLLKAL